ncbi:MAG TPA: acyltransferase family protein, partial [Nitrososphaerales archaeon]|nr:acyltransferase family protein [Nitrososphaerales archaeon]
MAKTTSYDPRLSGLRGSAAFLIVLYHVAGFGVPLAVPPLVAKLFDQSVVGFWVGVPVFLMLSMVLLLKSLDANPDIKHYFWRRIKRIWPIYFGSLIVIFLFFNAYTTYHLTVWDYVGFFTFTEYYVHPFINGPLGVFWTLQLEEAVYLFIPLIHSSRRKEWIGSILVGVGLTWTYLLFSTNVIASTWDTQSLLFYT